MVLPPSVPDGALGLAGCGTDIGEEWWTIKLEDIDRRGDGMSNIGSSGGDSLKLSVSEFRTYRVGVLGIYKHLVSRSRWPSWFVNTSTGGGDSFRALILLGDGLILRKELIRCSEPSNLLRLDGLILTGEAGSIPEEMRSEWHTDGAKSSGTGALFSLSL